MIEIQYCIYILSFLHCRKIMDSVDELELQCRISSIIVNLAMEDKRLWDTIQPSKDHFLNLVVCSYINYT